MSIVSTLTDKCKACYSCIRNCPVKAIKVEDGQAKVVETRCISCGNCVKVCSQGAKSVETDVDRILKLIDKEQVVALLAPSFPASFPWVDPAQIYQGLKNLGFDDIVEVSQGVKLTIPKYKEVLAATAEPVISSFCPAIVGLVEKHYPNLIPFLAPVDTAVVATGKLVKAKNPKAKAVFIGPCIAKKEEALNSQGVIDGVITFQELKALFGLQGIDLPSKENYSQDGSCVAGLFPVSGGLLKNLAMPGNAFAQELAVVEGKEDCLEIIKELNEGKTKPKFLDILFCKGCIDGPAVDSPIDLLSRKRVVVEYCQSKQADHTKLPDDLPLNRFFVDRHVFYPQPSESEIKEILKHTNKTQPEDEVNCEACGYSTCREKAIAVYHGLAEIDMCFHYLIHKSRGEIEYYKERLENIAGQRRLLDSIIGQSEGIHEVKRIAEKAAKSDSTILIQGESGVGKEVIAQAIHSLSDRKQKSFIGINCAALPELLLESELFGYEEGAFTGARKGGKPGKFELANGGTILLDEIGDMPLNMQAKLLRVLQEREFERVGGTQTIKLDIKIIAASNQNLKELAQEGKFRVDLFYRLNVINLSIPPLRERMEDIPLIVGHFIEKLTKQKRLQPKVFTEEALHLMMKYSWPGNVRELENVVERAFYIADDSVILPEHLPVNIRDLVSGSAVFTVKPFKESVAHLEKNLIIDALKATNNNKVNTAKLLGMPRATLYQKLKEHNLKEHNLNQP